MKILVVWITLLSFVVDTNAQDYQPMAIEGATWLFGYTDENPMWNDVRLHKIEGDTIVNGMTYAKLYQYHTDNESTLSINTKTRRLFGLLRDDITERKVYGGILDGQQVYFSNFLEVDATCHWGEEGGDFQEHLLYDFSLEVGDTLTGCMYIEHPTIASIEMHEEYGLSRRQFRFEDQNYLYHITEQIGNCIGIFKGDRQCFLTGGGFAYYLFDYCVGSFENCNLLTSTSNQIPSDLLEIYPNPVSNQLYIQSKIPSIQIEIMDAFGNKILTSKNTSEINMANYVSGFYILTLTTDDGQYHVEKLVKH